MSRWTRKRARRIELRASPAVKAALAAGVISQRRADLLLHYAGERTRG
jgi:hypothetical protein